MFRFSWLIRAVVLRHATSRNPRATRAMRQRTTKMKKAGIGSSFDDFLKEEGTYEVTEAIAIERLLSWEAEKEKHLGRSETGTSQDHDRAL